MGINTENMNEEAMNEENLQDASVDETATSESEADEATETESVDVEDEAADVTEENTEESSDDSSESGEEASGKKKLFGRKEKKDQKDDKIAELTDQLKRQMAEFDNFRKRTEKEKSSMYEMGASSIIEKILPIIDNFERGLATVPEDSQDPMATGMRMIYKQLLDELSKAGVKPIEALGKEFDPNFHNAVMQVESEEYESGFVAQEMQKGYMYKETVIRYSMVAVVQ